MPPKLCGHNCIETEKNKIAMYTTWYEHKKQSNTIYVVRQHFIFFLLSRTSLYIVFLLCHLVLGTAVAAICACYIVIGSTELNA